MTRPGNPANYECRNAKRTHYWRQQDDGTATCLNCGLVLSESDADEVFAGAVMATQRKKQPKKGDK